MKEERHCLLCAGDLEWACCWQCDGVGVDGHDCGEDCCPCLDPKPNEACDLCDGEGGWYQCPHCRGGLE